MLGPDGQPLQLTTDDIRADEFGRIYTEDGDAYLGQIGVFAFADNGQLTKNESGLFGAGGQAAEQYSRPFSGGGSRAPTWI